MRPGRNLVIDGNAVYEVDIECQERKRRREGKRRAPAEADRRPKPRKKPGD